MSAERPGDPFDGNALLSEQIRERLAGVASLSEAQLNACAVYLGLLVTWNRRINLTALPLGTPIPDLTIDKLIAEPLRALPLFSPDAKWADLGSGGGSPAIPLKIARPASRLHLIEARERKCAFLRNALRQLALPMATVHCARFEALPPSDSADGVSNLDLMTVRAVRLDAGTLDLIAERLRPGGRLVVFGPAPGAHEQFVVEPQPADGIATLRRL